MRHGIYHVSWGEQQNPKERQLQDLALAAHHGLDSVHFSHLQDIDHTKQLLQQAEALNMRLWLEDVEPDDRPALAGHSALLGFGIADDANTKPPADLGALCEIQAAAGEPRYISIGASVQQPNEWCYGLTDAIGVQLYPFPDEHLAAYWPILQQARQLASQNGQRLVANLQAHRLEEDKAAPNPEQIRAQGLMAAAAGADAILWYALQEPEGRRASEEVLKAIAAVTKELRRFSLESKLSGEKLHIQQRDHLLDMGIGGRRLQLDLLASRVNEA